MSLDVTRLTNGIAASIRSSLIGYFGIQYTTTINNARGIDAIAAGVAQAVIQEITVNSEANSIPVTIPGSGYSGTADGSIPGQGAIK